MSDFRGGANLSRHRSVSCWTELDNFTQWCFTITLAGTMTYSIFIIARVLTASRPRYHRISIDDFPDSDWLRSVEVAFHWCAFHAKARLTCGRLPSSLPAVLWRAFFTGKDKLIGALPINLKMLHLRSASDIELHVAVSTSLRYQPLAQRSVER